MDNSFNNTSDKSYLQRQFNKERSDNVLYTGYPHNFKRPWADTKSNFSPISISQNADYLKGNHTTTSAINVLSDINSEMVNRSAKRKRPNSAIIKKINVTNRIVEETPTSSLGSGVKTFYCSQDLCKSVNKWDSNIMQTIVPSGPTRDITHSQTKISQYSTYPTITDSKTISGIQGSQYTYPPADNSFKFSHDGGLIGNQGYIMSQLYDSQTVTSQQNKFNNMHKQEYTSQLYGSNCSITQNQKILPYLPYHNIPAVSNSMNNFQSQQSISDCMVKSDCLFKSNNRQPFDPGCTVPFIWPDMNIANKKIPLKNEIGSYHHKNEFSNENNSSPLMTSSCYFSPNNNRSMNNTPVEFTKLKTLDNTLNQQKLCNEESSKDFNKITEATTTDFNSPNLYGSFPSTPVDANPLILPPTLLLSNYCSEYDKAYTMKDLKPNQYRNYRHHESLRSLKEHLDSIIPQDMTLKDFYKIKNLR